MVSECNAPVGTELEGSDAADAMQVEQRSTRSIVKADGLSILREMSHR